MEKHPISTGFLGFPLKLACFPWFLPCLHLEDAISTAFFLMMNGMNGRNCQRGMMQFQATSRGLPRRKGWTILCGIVGARRPAPAQAECGERALVRAG
jgi:hypothetical protein